jgi:hypothetical protein
MTSRSYTSSPPPPSASMACSGTPLLLKQCFLCPGCDNVGLIIKPWRTDQKSNMHKPVDCEDAEGRAGDVKPEGLCYTASKQYTHMLSDLYSNMFSSLDQAVGCIKACVRACARARACVCVFVFCQSFCHSVGILSNALYRVGETGVCCYMGWLSNYLCFQMSAAVNVCTKLWPDITIEVEVM